jgi:hypothetical protein
MDTSAQRNYLAGMASQSLDWILRHLHGFAVSQQAGDATRLKALNELALVLPHWSRWAEAARVTRTLGPMIRRIHELAWAEACSVQLREIFHSLLQERLHVLYAYLNLRDRNRTHPDMERLVDSGLNLTYLLSTEVTPFRNIERQALLYRCGLLPSEPDWRQLWMHTLLSSDCDSTWYSDADSYAATHTILFLTDFGIRDIPLTASDRDRVTRVLNELSVHYTRKGFWDLLGELLLCQHLLGERSQISDLCTRRFLGVIGDDGSVPAKSPESARAPGDPFGARYHTTLIAITYCLSVLCGMQEPRRC